jgi:hypothetical protein
MSFNVTNLISTVGFISGYAASTGSTSAPSTMASSTLAIDLSPYINVNKRPVKVILAVTGSTTGTTYGLINCQLYGASSSAGTYAACSTASTGGTLQIANTSTGAIVEFNVIPTYRWVTPYITHASTAASVASIVAIVQAFSRSE